ncbi:MAG: M15 family metallopeptidase [Gammaproteobacteria bacterium]
MPGAFETTQALLSLFYQAWGFAGLETPDASHQHECMTESSEPNIESSRPADIVDLGRRIPSLKLDLKYALTDNFTGIAVSGYEHPRALMTEAAAEAMAKAQERAEEFGLSLLIFDAYRPQRAVEAFRAWSADDAGPDTKADYYPREERNALFDRGFLASHSSHSRGSTADLTLVDAVSGEALDMGTRFDLFDSLSYTHSKAINAQQRANRLLLISIMEQAGFENYWMEWWHFTLKDEPYPHTYFDFPIN